MMHKCNLCGKQMQTTDDVELMGFTASGWRCSCGNVHARPEDVFRISKLATALRKHKLQVKIYKTGNSYSARLPKEIVDLYGLTKKTILPIVPKKHEIGLIVPA